MLNVEWLKNEIDLIFQICDELVKNAVKSNYKFLLIMQELEASILERNPHMSLKDVKDWLRDVFLSGSEELIQRQLQHIHEPNSIIQEVNKIIHLEKDAHKRNKNSKKYKNMKIDSNFIPLLKIRKLSREYKIFVHLKIYCTGNEYTIMISNDSPILENDAGRIRKVREKFGEYYNAGRPEAFFMDNIDTGGGGHGLGYALIDAILLQLGLVPETSLFLIPGGGTVVLIVLPIKDPRIK